MTKPGKYTKWQYKKDLAANAAAMDAVKIEIEACHSEAFKSGVTEKLSDRFNAAWDREYELNYELRDIEYRWTTRNWNGADWTLHELVRQNID